MKQAYRLRTKNRPQLVLAMMRALASEDAIIAFEGRLSHTGLVTIEGVRLDETGVLRRATLRPKLDFVVLPLTPASLPTIERALVSKIAFNRQEGIVHVQIEKHGQIAFSAYDQFHEDSVTAYPMVPVALLEKLVEKRVLHSYTAV